MKNFIKLLFSLKTMFWCWIICMLVFLQALFQAQNTQAAPVDDLTFAFVIASVLLGGVFFLVVVGMTAVGLFRKATRKRSIKYGVATVLAFVGFFAIVFAVFENAAPQTTVPQKSADLLFIADRSACDEQATLVKAKNCTFTVDRDDGGHGTAFSIAPGYLVTNKHVVEDAKKLTTWIDGEVEVSLWNYSPTYDIAVLKVPQTVPTCEWFDSSNMNLAEALYAIGWPNESAGESTITKGIFSRMNIFEGGLEFVQTDAPINPGNSGGPLVNECGVVGVNTLKSVWADEQTPLEGLGNALSSKFVAPLIKQLIDEGELGTKIPQSSAQDTSARVGGQPRTNAVRLEASEIHAYMADLQEAKDSWMTSSSELPQEDYNMLIDSFTRQILFCEELLSRLQKSDGIASRDDLFMWDSIVKMSYESEALARRLNNY